MFNTNNNTHNSYFSRAFILGISEACEHHCKRLQLGSQQADRIHIWSPVFLQGRGGGSSLKVQLPLPPLNFLFPHTDLCLAASERLPLCCLQPGATDCHCLGARKESGFMLQGWGDTSHSFGWSKTGPRARAWTTGER